MMYLQYLWSVVRHKWFVFVEACRLGVPWLGLIHDLSKFLPDEFVPYARHFYGNYPSCDELRGDWRYTYTGLTKEDVKREFDIAWLQHQKRNRHHWQYWVLMNDDPKPERWTIQEMSIESPPILSCDNQPLLWCEYDHGDNAIHSKANRVLRDICAQLNKIDPLPMPDRYRKEMLADWHGAGRAYGNKNTQQWYSKNHYKIALHQETRRWIEKRLAF